MSKSLLVVESPAKARTIANYLGDDFVIKASVGHIKDLPPSQLGVDLEKQFTPQYQVIKGKSKIIKEIKEAAEKASTIYLATDPDREGEAIAWHIAEELKQPPEAIHCGNGGRRKVVFGGTRDLGSAPVACLVM